MHALWKSLDLYHVFKTADEWDLDFGNQEGEIVVWELRCMEGRYQNIEYTFNNHRCTYT
jgi:hypothetical protein